MTRELSDDDVRREAQACRTYIGKPGSRGASWWVRSKGFSAEDASAIIRALGDMDEAPEVIA